jgi:hypothetical protein
MTERETDTHGLLNVPVCVSLSQAGRWGIPLPGADSHGSLTVAVSKRRLHVAQPKRIKGGESIAGVCKDEQAERGEETGRLRRNDPGHRQVL